MFFKRKLLRLVKKAVKMEEELIPIYSNHCSLFSNFLDFDSSTQQRFVEVLTQIRDESREHKEKLANLIKTIEETL